MERYIAHTGYPRTWTRSAGSKRRVPSRATHQTLATPTIALSKSSSLRMPSVSYSMAWLAPWLFGFVTVRLYLLRIGLSEHACAEEAKSL